MTESTCPHAADVLAAARHREGPEGPGGPEAGLSRHLASCASCRDLVAVDATLRGAAAALAPALPAPAALRFRAERRRAELARARALAPLRIWRATAAVAFAGTLVWLGGALAPAARLFDPGTTTAIREVGGPGAGGASGANLALFALLALGALAGLWLNTVEGVDGAE